MWATGTAVRGVETNRGRIKKHVFPIKEKSSPKEEDFFSDATAVSRERSNGQL